METKDLAKALSGLDQGAARAQGWVSEVSRTAPTVARQSDSLTDAARKARLTARRLSQAVGRNNCVGVFGPSQAGKSYLVSALAKPKDGRLTIRLGAESRDFLREINPPGDRESTGLVTRFTVKQSATDPDYPIRVRLLTETDIVKILANSFFLDFDPNNMTIPPVEEEQIRGLLSSLEGQAGTGVGSRSGEGSGHLDEIALFDLSQYFRQNFKSRIGAFDRVDYWRGLIALGGRLDREKRAALFEVLWGCLPEFTALYLHLVEALEQVGHAPEALVGLKGLIPREAGSPPEPNSIIDVAILSRMGSARDAQDTIPMRLSGADGPTDVALPRATLTALIAEICLTIQDSPWPFFDHTDLLDFPGARSRLKLLAMPPDAEEKESQKRELYLRGKIAYLFQRYTDELELTSMLLCMPPSVAEVKDLSALVKNWIEATHGATPERRKAVRNALFLVLTKHDMEFIEKGGETDDSRMGKWDRRLHASLLELYGKEGWPQNWDGKPFANTYFLRNPGMKQVHLMSYVDEAALIEDRPVDSPAFATYRQAFLTSPLTEKYFSDRPAAWEAAMAPNDGGIAYLVSALEGVLDPGLKQRQAAERLVDAAGSLDQPLRGLYFEDGDAALKEQDGKMLGLRKALHAGFKLTDLRGFALFLRSLMLDESEIREIFLTVAALRLDETGVLDGSGSESGSEAPVVAEEDDPWDDPWAEPDPSPAAEDQTAAARSGAPARRERADLFAERLMNHWAGKLREHGQNQALLTQLGLSADDYALVVDELLVGMNRLAVPQSLTEVVRTETATPGTRWADVADRITQTLQVRFNDFIAYLGTQDQPIAERPGFPEPPKAEARKVFSDGGLVAPGTDLGPSREMLDRTAFIDWGVALRSFGNANVGHSAGREITDDQNRALGEILEVIRP